MHMKSHYQEFTLVSQKETDLINITETVHSFVASSGIQSGMVFIVSFHTTTGITVNEPLPDLESDISAFLNRIVDENIEYRHARFLHSDGQMAVNAPSHLRQAVIGFEVFFPIEKGKIRCGARQAIYFVELDGPQERKYCLKAIGDE
jgi:secondary thiamine-phosphate synthase enzyme